MSKIFSQIAKCFLNSYFSALDQSPIYSSRLFVIADDYNCRPFCHLMKNDIKIFGDCSADDENIRACFSQLFRYGFFQLVHRPAKYSISTSTLYDLCPLLQAFCDHYPGAKSMTQFCCQMTDGSCTDHYHIGTFPDSALTQCMGDYSDWFGKHGHIIAHVFRDFLQACCVRRNYGYPCRCHARYRVFVRLRTAPSFDF